MRRFWFWALMLFAAFGLFNLTVTVADDITASYSVLVHLLSPFTPLTPVVYWLSLLSIPAAVWVALRSPAPGAD